MDSIAMGQICLIVPFIQRGKKNRCLAQAMPNARSRLRMLALYAFAGHHPMMVTGKGNKVEDFGVGFYIESGDGGVVFRFIANMLLE